MEVSSTNYGDPETHSMKCLHASFYAVFFSDGKKSYYKANTVESRFTATSVIRSLGYNGYFFGLPGKAAIHFLVKKKPLLRSPVNTANFFLPIGDRINGVPL